MEGYAAQAADGTGRGDAGAHDGGAPISVVIPTCDSAARLAPTLAALIPGVGEGMVRQLILVDGGSRDDLAALADAVGADLVRGPPGGGARLAAGAAAARGEWLLFLNDDTRLGDDWVVAARRHIETRPSQAGWFRLRFDARSGLSRRLAVWINLRARLFGAPSGEQGLLIARSVYDAVDGHPPIPRLEDVALARRLGRNRLAPLDAEAIVSVEGYRRGRHLRREAFELGCLLLGVLGVPPDRIAVGRRAVAGRSAA